MYKYKVTMSYCKIGSCDVVGTFPVPTLKEAHQRFENIKSGRENYGQFLVDPHDVAVILSLWRGDKKLRTMQIN